MKRTSSITISGKQEYDDTILAPKFYHSGIGKKLIFYFAMNLLIGLL